MAIAEASWYSAGIAIILASVYALRLTRIQNFLSKIFLALGAWLENTAKEEFEYQVPLATSKEKLTASKYTSAWWTDEKQFQLERRAIFSKVCSLFFIAFEIVDNFTTDLAICDPCFKVPEAR